MDFHPHAKAYWMPIAYAIPGGLFAGALGYCASLNWYVAGACASGMALIVWWVWAVTWKDIVTRSYAPAQPEPVEDEPQELDPNDIQYVIKCAHPDQPGTTHYVSHLPCSPSDLQHIAMRYNEGTPLTFEHWKSELGEPQFRAVIQWMNQNHWITYNGPKKAVTELEYGKCVLLDLAANGIQEALTHSKTGTMPVDNWIPRQIKTVVK